MYITIAEGFRGELKFYRKIDVYYQELRSEKLNPEHLKFYDRFFTIQRKQLVRRVFVPNDKAILEFQDKYARVFCDYFQ